MKIDGRFLQSLRDGLTAAWQTILTNVVTCQYWTLKATVQAHHDVGRGSLSPHSHSGVSQEDRIPPSGRTQHCLFKGLVTPTGKWHPCRLISLNRQQYFLEPPSNKPRSSGHWTVRLSWSFGRNYKFGSTQMFSIAPSDIVVFFAY